MIAQRRVENDPRKGMAQALLSKSPVEGRSMFAKRSNKQELMDDLSLSSAALAQNLRELEFVNLWLGGKSTLISALNKILMPPSKLKSQTIRIADLGCGGGDLLITIQQWAKAKHLRVELFGFDANPFVIQYAVNHSQAQSKARFVTANILSDQFKSQDFDIVCLNTFCHHFCDADLIRLLRQLKNQTSTAIVINDLHRHWLAYFSIKWISRFLHFSYLAQHDGPLSVLRAFRKKEIMDLINKAHFDRYRICWRWAFRWEVILWKRS